MATAVRENKKSFHKYINSKRRTKENFHPLLDAAGNVTTEDKEEAEVLNTFFTSAFNRQISYPQGTLRPDQEVWDAMQNTSMMIQVEMVRELLLHLDCRNSMGLDGLHPRVLRELAGVIAEPLSAIYQRSWLSGEVPEDWRLVDVTPIYKKGRKEDPGNYSPVSLTLVPGKVMEQIILGEITRHMCDIQGIRPSQHGFMKRRSYLTNLISFYNWVTRLVDEAIDVVYLDFSKAFHTVSLPVFSWGNGLPMAWTGIPFFG